MVEYLVIWHPDENMLHLYQSFYYKVWYHISLNFSKHDLYKWFKFHYDTNWQNIVPWIIPFFHFDLAVRWLSGDWTQIVRDVGNESFLKTKRIAIDWQCNDGCRWRYRSLADQLKMSHPCRFYGASLILDIASYIALYVRVVLKSQYLFGCWVNE